MSTPVIVATEQEGVARLFHRNGDGALTQTGQLLVGPVDPATLATLAADLNEHLNWTKLARARKEPPAELPAAPKPKLVRSRAVKRSREDVTAYRESVAKLIADRPGVTIPELVLTLHSERSKVNDNLVRAATDSLRGQRRVYAAAGSTRNDPKRWYAQGQRP